MLYQVLMRMIERGVVDGMKDKLDVFFAAGQLTKVEYTALSSIIGGSPSA